MKMCLSVGIRLFFLTGFISRNKKHCSLAEANYFIKSINYFHSPESIDFTGYSGGVRFYFKYQFTFFIKINLE